MPTNAKISRSTCKNASLPPLSIAVISCECNREAYFTYSSDEVTNEIGQVTHELLSHFEASLKGVTPEKYRKLKRRYVSVLEVEAREGEEDEEDGGEVGEEDEDKTEVAVAKYLSEDAPIELPMDAIVHAADASPYSIQRAVGTETHCLLWRQDEGMLLMASKNLLIEEDLETNMQKFAQHELNSTIDSIDVSESSQLLVTGATKSKGSVRVWK
ncbi:hypothetical protein TrCOL_g10286, partial [Triparma columacea]